MSHFKTRGCLMNGGGVSYYVVADFDRYTEQCIGMCNFYEDSEKLKG